MKAYIDKIKEREPHERRKHALQIAGVVVGLFVIAWIATFSARLNSGTPLNAPQNSDQAAAAQTALPADAAQLQISTTSVYSY